MRHLYLHGFASGPGSKKGTAFAAHFAARGVAIDRLDLRVPSFEHLRLSAMIDATAAAIGGPDDRAIVLGSSLGGLTAARLAARDPRVVAVVLLAPAFRIAARWRASLGDELEAWRRTGRREVLMFTPGTTGGTAAIDFGFFEELERLDALDGGEPDVRVPALILHGTGDDVVPIDHSRRYAAGRPHVRLVELPDNHELVASLPVLLDETERFLAGLATPPPGRAGRSA